MTDAPGAAPTPRAAILGAGEIGSGWAALFAAHGWDVCVLDPDPRAAERVARGLDAARAIGVGGGAAAGRVLLEDDPARAAAGAAWVQESLPERLELKREVLHAAAPAVGAGAVLASSTSTLLPSALADGLPCADRTLVAHPLHPVYAVPVVEVCAARQTAPAALARAAATLRALGREPVALRAELPGLAANRLTAALLREALDLVERGAISAADLDRLVARGIALGWAAVGPLRTEALGAGAGGFAAFLDRMAEPLQTLWRSLASWHSLSRERRAALAAAVGPPEMRDAHAEEAWAEVLTRVAGAAAPGGR